MTRAAHWPALVVMLWLAGCLARTGAFGLGALVMLVVTVEVWLLTGLIVRAGLERAGLPAFGGVGALVVGHYLVTLGQCVLTIVAPGSTAICSVLFAAGVAIVAVRCRGPAPHPGIGRASVAATLLAVGSATVWAWVSMQGLVVGASEATLVPWNDVTYHSAWVAHLAAASASSTIDHPLLVDAGFHFYPVGSHMLPATLVQWTDVGALPATVGVWLPFGQVLTPLAAFEFGRLMWGRVAGLGATVVVGFGPDAAAAWPGNPYLSYHWLQLTAPGGAYACGSAALAVAFTLLGCRPGGARLLVLAGLLVASTAASKPQIVLALLPLLFGIVLLRHPNVSRRGRWVSAGLALLAPWLLGMVGRRLVPGLGLAFDGSGAKRYLHTLAGQQTDGELRWLTDVVTPTSPWWIDAAAGAPYLVLATLGLPLLGIAVVAWFVPAATTAPRRGVVPLLAIVVYTGLTLGLGGNESGQHTTDALVHRPLVFAWFLVAAWAGGRIGAALATAPAGRRRTWFTVAAVAGALVAVLHAQGRSGDAHRTVPWGGKFAGKRVPAALERCAVQLRDHSEPGAVVQHSGEDADLILVAVAERRAFLVDSHLIAGGGEASATLAARRQRLQRLYDADTVAEVAAVARDLGIDYVVLASDRSLAWPQSLLARPWFEAGDHRVYRLRELR